MKVRLVAQISGTRDGEDWPTRGSVVDLPADEAAVLVANRLAVEAEAAPETAAAPKPETAAAPKPKPRRAAPKADEA